MLLEEFSSTSLQRHAKEVLDSASLKPVVIRRSGGNDLVLMSKEKYLNLAILESQKLELDTFWRDAPLKERCDTSGGQNER